MFLCTHTIQGEVRVVVVDKTQSRVYKMVGLLGKRCLIKGKHYHVCLLLIAM